MQFEELKHRLSKVSNLPLPGERAQHLMAPTERLRTLSTIDIESKNPRSAGVFALFYPSRGKEAMLVLILRKTYKGVHSNQVGFPGGKWEEEDRDLEDTARRETEEEVGVNRTDITLVKKMTRLYIPPSNFWVQPYMGFVDYTPSFVPEQAEVEAILEVRATDLLAPENLISKKMVTSQAMDLEAPAFLLNNQVVWGATAMMLSEMKELMRNA